MLTTPSTPHKMPVHIFFKNRFIFSPDSFVFPFGFYFILYHKNTMKNITKTLIFSFAKEIA